MFITDIIGAIERGDVAVLEEAFRILVGWPSEGNIEGASPKALNAALGRVCEALATDDAMMPDRTLAIISGAAEGLTGSSFSAGAYHVK